MNKSKTEAEKHNRKANKENSGKIVKLRGQSTNDSNRLHHELSIHQTELETQNEKLRLIQIELENSRKKYADLYNFAPVGYFTFDKNGKVIEANHTGCQMLEVEKGDLVGKPFDSFIVKNSKDKFYIHLRKVILEKSKDSSEITLTKANGEKFTVRLDSIPAEANDEVILCRTIITDITELKRQQEALNKINRILDAHSISIRVMIQAKNELQYLQEVCEIITKNCGYSMAWIGYTEDDKGKSIRPAAYSGLTKEVFEKLRLEWIAMKNEYKPAYRAVWTGETVVWQDINKYLEPKMWPPTAIKLGFKSCTAIPLKSEGKPFGVLAIFSPETDSFTKDEIELLTELSDDLVYGINAIRINAARTNAEEQLKELNKELEKRVEMRTATLNKTVNALESEINRRIKIQDELQKSENKYRELVENANSIIMRRTVDGKITFFNEFAEKFFGYSEDEIIGKNVIGTIVPCEDQSGKDMLKMISDIGSDPEAYRNNENENVLKSGRRVWIAWTNKAITDKDGKIVEILCVGNDITARKFAQMERDRLNEKLNALAVRLRNLNRTIIETEQRERQRLAKILHDNLQQLLVAAKLYTASLQHKLKDNILYESAGEINSLLIQSLDVSRSLTAELYPVVLHEGSFIETLQWLTSQMLQKYGLKINLDVNKIYDCEIERDSRIILFEAVREALFNIVKHANTKSAEIRACCLKDMMKIEIEDKGSGFDVSEYEDAKCQCHEGKFGLFSIRERLNLINGQIDIQSQKGQGTHITLFAPALPRTISRKTPQPAIEPPKAAVAGRKISNRKIRILLADDHNIVRQGLHSLLENETTIEVVGEAEDGLKAVEMIDTCKPDVVIMDVSMPTMDGIEATRRIMKKTSNIKIIGLSLYQEEEISRKMLDAGAVAYMTKLEARDKLLETIFKYVS